MNNKEIRQYYKNNELDLEMIIKDFSSYVLKIVNNMGYSAFNEEDKEEIISDVFFVLWNNREKLDRSKYMNSYLAGITKNIVREHLRKHNINLDISDYENSLCASDNVDLFDNNFDRIARIEKIIYKLKDIDKSIFVDFYYSSKSIKDIAKENNISEFNVKQRLYRIRKKIRKEVK